MLTLGITTSSGQFAVVISQADEVIYIDKTENMAQKKELYVVLQEAMGKLGRHVKDISDIIVDIGPGGTSSVRTGVSFANALAYGLVRHVSPVSSFELIGLEIWQTYNRPSIITAKSIKNNAFIGYFNNNRLEKMLYGKIAEHVDNLIDSEEIYVAGAHQDMICELAGKNYTIHKSGILRAKPEVIIANRERFTRKKLLYPDMAMPITEQNVGGLKVKN